MTTALIITMNRVEKVTTRAGVRGGTLRERMSRQRRTHRGEEAEDGEGRGGVAARLGHQQRAGDAEADEAQPRGRPPSRRRTATCRAARRGARSGRWRSGRRWACGSSAVMKREDGAPPRSTSAARTQGLKALGSSRISPMAKTTGRHHRQAAMPRMTSTWKGGASDSASFMQVSFATKAPVASRMAPMPRRFWEMAIGILRRNWEALLGPSLAAHGPPLGNRALLRAAVRSPHCGRVIGTRR